MTSEAESIRAEEALLISRVWARACSFSGSDFGRNAIWFTGLSAFERVFAVTQTVLIARALGITEYGVYGLLFGTIGFVASVVGLQMGLTATVFVARYRASEKAKAAAVITMVHRFGFGIAAAFVALMSPFSATISGLLLGSAQYQIPVLLGTAFVGAAIVSGVQDGIAQGFEIFKTMAKLKTSVSLLVLVVIWPMTRYFGLVGVVSAILAGQALKYSILRAAIMRSRIEAEIPPVGVGVSFRSLVSGFALPSMIVSLATGFVTWLGMFLLSRQPGGFKDVAIASTGFQWRGPLLLLASSVGTVAIPVFSRFAAQNNEQSSRHLRTNILLFNFIVSTLVALSISLASTYILGLYGSAFLEGRLAFCIILLSCVPAIMAQVYMQQLVGANRMWRQLIVHIPYFSVTIACLVFLIPDYRVLGYSLSLLVGAVVYLGCAFIADNLDKVSTR